MKASSLLLAATLLLPAAGAFAQSCLAAGTQNPVGGGFAAPTAAQSDAGSLTYFGTVTSHDANHEQFARLQHAFETSKPTLVFYENPNLGIDGSAEATINRLGEAGYVRFLTQQYLVPAVRLDDPVAEYAYVSARVAPEQRKLYYLLRETQRMQVRTGATKRLMVKAMRQFIANSAYFIPGTEQVIRNLAGLKKAYRQHGASNSNWWTVTADAFNPTLTTAAIGDGFNDTVNGIIRAFREQYLYRQLAEQAQAGQRVLVVMGRDHLPFQAQVANKYLANK